eukprot:TRINITY_DN10325_c0_g1_i1.p1 TRINITY_DN10325_c0_g1~~TRINITY_DN10325_c0_g1_i1.p1  ORF type:complete len:299 (-),score=40.55 TRINITY_DN10325_c0_g1_i1:246-1142(-)
MLEGVNLKWNDFEENIIKSFKDFRAILNDVTIFCGPEKVQANKFVLCASSEIFREMLINCELSRQQNPTVILWDVDINLMNLILDFMYIGEVKISEGDLNEFLGLAKRLRVRGLVAEEPKNQPSGEVAQGGGGDCTQQRQSSNDFLAPISQTNSRESSLKRLIKKKSLMDNDRENSVSPSKSSRLENSSDVYNDSSNKEVIDLEEVLKTTQNSMLLKSHEELFGKTSSQSLPDQDPYHSFLHQSVPDLEPLRVETALDSFNNSLLDPSYKCNLCLKTYKTKGSLYNHMSLYHRGQKGE